jgi:hypothetical protein
MNGKESFCPLKQFGQAEGDTTATLSCPPCKITIVFDNEGPKLVDTTLERASKYCRENPAFPPQRDQI